MPATLDLHVVAPPAMFDAADVTCVATDPHGSRVFTGDANGIVRCFVKEAESDGRTLPPPAGTAEAPPLLLQWTARAAYDAVLSVCTALDLRAPDGTGVLLVVGTATGELVFFRNEMETRRIQLQSAVLRICALAGSESEFVAGDVLGTLYGVNQYGILWSHRVTHEPQTAHGVTSGSADAFFYPPPTQPLFQAIASVSVLDVEGTLSTYALVSTGERQLLLTHRGVAVAAIPVRTPVRALASFPVERTNETTQQQQQPSVVLAAGDAGQVYRISTTREPAFQFVVDDWAEVPFPVAKLFPIRSRSVPIASKDDASDAESESFAWVCVGTAGDVALFRGKQLVRVWNDVRAPASSQGGLVDTAVLHDNDDTTSLAVAYSSQLEVFTIAS